MRKRKESNKLAVKENNNVIHNKRKNKALFLKKNKTFFFECFYFLHITIDYLFFSFPFLKIFS